MLEKYDNLKCRAKLSILPYFDITMGVSHSFSIKNIFYDEMNLRHFLVSCDDMQEVCCSKPPVITRFVILENLVHHTN